MGVVYSTLTMTVRCVCVSVCVCLCVCVHRHSEYIMAAIQAHSKHDGWRGAGGCLLLLVCCCLSALCYDTGRQGARERRQGWSHRLSRAASASTCTTSTPAMAGGQPMRRLRPSLRARGGRRGEGGCQGWGLICALSEAELKKCTRNCLDVVGGGGDGGGGGGGGAGGGGGGGGDEPPLRAPPSHPCLNTAPLFEGTADTLRGRAGTCGESQAL